MRFQAKQCLLATAREFVVVQRAQRDPDGLARHGSVCMFCGCRQASASAAEFKVLRAAQALCVSRPRASSGGRRRHPPSQLSSPASAVPSSSCRAPPQLSCSIPAVVLHPSCRSPPQLSCSTPAVVLHPRCCAPPQLSFSTPAVVLHPSCHAPSQLSCSTPAVVLRHKAFPCTKHKEVQACTHLRMHSRVAVGLSVGHSHTRAQIHG